MTLTEFFDLKPGYLKKSDNLIYTILKNKYTLAEIKSAKKVINKLKRENKKLKNPVSSKLFQKQGMYIVIGCVHIPFHNKILMDALFDLIEDHKEEIKGFVIAGDFLDMNALSQYDRGMISTGVTLGDEYKAANKVLDRIDSLIPNVDKGFIYGNHCYEEGTKVLTQRGFIDFRELHNSDLIASFDKSMNISYNKPLRIINNYYKGNLYEVENTYHKQSVTDLHDIVLNDFSKVKAQDLSISDIKNIPLNGNLNNPDYDISDDMLKLIVNIVCDATLVDEKRYNKNSEKKRIQFKLSKERKIKNLLAILDNLNLPYTLQECKKSKLNKLQPYYIRLYSDIARNLFSLLDNKKEFPNWFRSLSERQVKLVVEELSITDGNKHDGGISWTSTNLNDVNLIQEIAISNGFCMNYKTNTTKSGFNNSKIQYNARIHVNHNPLIKSKLTVKFYEGNVYCVETTNGTVITQLDGKTSFSGNCARYIKYIKNIDNSKLGSALLSPEKALKLHQRGYLVKTDWVNDSITIGKHLDVYHGEFCNIHPAKKALDTYKSSVLFYHSHRISSHVESDMGAFNGGFMGDINSNVFNYASKAQKKSWTNGFNIVQIDEQGLFNIQQLIFYNNKFYYGSKPYGLLT